MSHTFVRKLTFQSNNLGKDAALMLTFDADMEGLYEDFFPVVWKVSTFGKTGPYRAHATYTNQLAFSKPQVVGGNIIDAEASVKINDSEKTILTEANAVYHFSPPQAGTCGVRQAVNNTGAIQDIAVGFIAHGELMPEPVLFFEGVEDGSYATAQFTPVLRAYITSDYQETEIIRGVVDTPAVWKQNLAELPHSTAWNVNRDKTTGLFTITAA